MSVITSERDTTAGVARHDAPLIGERAYAAQRKVYRTTWDRMQDSDRAYITSRRYDWYRTGFRQTADKTGRRLDIPKNAVKEQTQNGTSRVRHGFCRHLDVLANQALAYPPSWLVFYAVLRSERRDQGRARPSLTYRTTSGWR
jgi:hypothetical protein